MINHRKITSMRNRARSVAVSPGRTTMTMGLRKNSKHPASVDGVLFTAQRKAASHAETSELLLTAKKAGRRELGRHGC
jgi:hypothetical protein